MFFWDISIGDTDMAEAASCMNLIISWWKTESNKVKKGWKNRKEITPKVGMTFMRRERQSFFFWHTIFVVTFLNELTLS